MANDHKEQNENLSKKIEDLKKMANNQEKCKELAKKLVQYISQNR